MEHQKLRSAGITSAVEIDGRVYVGRGMLSTAGTSYQSGRAADLLLDQLEEFEGRCRTDPAYIERLLHRTAVAPPAAPDFEFVFLSDGYGVRETSTGAVIDLTDLSLMA